MRWLSFIVLATSMLIPVIGYADAFDDLVNALLQGKPENEIEPLLEKVYEMPKLDPQKLVERAHALNSKAGELLKGTEPPEKGVIEGTYNAIKIVCQLLADFGWSAGDTVVPKLIENLDAGDPSTNAELEIALNCLTGKTFTEAAFRSINKDPQEWSDRKEMWNKWWTDHGGSELVLVQLKVLNESGLTIRIDGSEANAPRVVAELFKGLAHEERGVRHVSGLLLAQVMGGEGGYAAQEDAETRDKAITKMRGIYEGNKNAVHDVVKSAMTSLAKKSSER
jgi:hypothetical protein